MEQKENMLILYKDDEGKVSVNTRFADEDVRLTQVQLFGNSEQPLLMLPFQTVNEITKTI